MMADCNELNVEIVTQQCYQLYSKIAQAKSAKAAKKIYYRIHQLAAQLEKKCPKWWSNSAPDLLDILSISAYYDGDYPTSVIIGTYLLEHHPYKNETLFLRYQTNRNYAAKKLFENHHYESYPTEIIKQLTQRFHSTTQLQKSNGQTNGQITGQTTEQITEQTVEQTVEQNTGQNTGQTTGQTNRETNGETNGGTKEAKHISDKVTFTITTCKRPDLFYRTINSFLQCCLDVDLIDRWICIDDNSNENDREEMQKKYPFFEFIWKGPAEKGHVQSMNILRETVKTPYQFHCEDDWSFICPGHYIQMAMEILQTDRTIGQVLINRNYAEFLDHISHRGGHHDQTLSGLQYIRHQYVGDEHDRNKLTQFLGAGHFYWPHFSFRPSLIRREVFDKVGPYHDIIHFEMRYAERYTQARYKSVFFPSIYCIHIGRPTSEWQDPTKPNAYALNGVKQF